MPVTSTSGDTGNGATLTFATTAFAVGLQNIQGWTEEVERLEVSTLATTSNLHLYHSVPIETTHKSDYDQRE